MPKNTFFNLPEAKREAVRRAAIAEFAAHSFRNASVNRIVAHAGIAKGSFYQYFDDKNDLFLYVLQVIGQEKLQYLSPVLQDSENKTFAQLLRDLYLAGVQFALQHPLYAEISKKFLQSKGTPIYEEVIQQSLPAAYEFFEPLLQKAIQRGEVRADIDVKMTAFFLTNLNTALVEYYLEHVSSNYDERMIETIDKFLALIIRGIGMSTPSPTNKTKPLDQKEYAYERH